MRGAPTITKSCLQNMAPIDAFLRENGGYQKCYVDTGPILERDFATTSGLSWQGKSTMCLNERLGTWFFIGVILTTLEFEPDPPVKNRCGSCTRCIDVCPTRAITLPYQLDARRCISYLTIENKGPIPIEFRSAIGDRIYGCDDCLEVCPWNRFAQQTRETRFQLPNQLKTLTLRQLAAVSDDEFRALFRDSPVKRIKRARFVRNVCVALGNVGTREDLTVLNQLARDTDPLIAEHASWAVEQIRNRQDQNSELLKWAFWFYSRPKCETRTEDTGDTESRKSGRTENGVSALASVGENRHGEPSINNE